MFHRARQVLAVTLLILLANSAPAAAKDFVSIPEAQGDEKNIEIRLLRYQGGTNGEMVVQVKNTGKAKASFQAQGLFFVPEGDPEKAPQRLGASGAFTEIAGSKKIVHEKQMVLAAGEQRELHLEVFCIDSHRSSPSSSTAFSLGKKKLPKKMQQTMRTGNAAIYKQSKGDLRKAKSAVQSHMWKTRDADWVELEGERANEKAPKSAPPRQQRVYERRIPNSPRQQKRK